MKIWVLLRLSLLIPYGKSPSSVSEVWILPTCGRFNRPLVDVLNKPVNGLLRNREKMFNFRARIFRAP